MVLFDVERSPDGFPSTRGADKPPVEVFEVGFVIAVDEFLDGLDPVCFTADCGDC